MIRILAAFCGLALGQVQPLNVKDDELPPRAAALLEPALDPRIRLDIRGFPDRIAELRPDDLTALSRLLSSPDRRRRQVAAYILMQRKDVAPTEELFREAIEGLKDDDMPGEWREEAGSTAPNIANAAEGTRFLAQHVQEAETLLLEGLKSADLQQRFLCAVALGFGGRAGAVEQAAPILLPHLKDNKIEGDAILAACALFRFGLSVTRIVEKELANPADAQEAALLNLILLELRPPGARESAPARAYALRTIPWIEGLSNYPLRSLCIGWHTRMTIENRDTPRGNLMSPAGRPGSLGRGKVGDSPR